MSSRGSPRSRRSFASVVRQAQRSSVVPQQRPSSASPAERKSAVASSSPRLSSRAGSHLGSRTAPASQVPAARLSDADAAIVEAASRASQRYSSYQNSLGGVTGLNIVEEVEAYNDVNAVWASHCGNDLDHPFSRMALAKIGVALGVEAKLLESTSKKHLCDEIKRQLDRIAPGWLKRKAHAAAKYAGRKWEAQPKSVKRTVQAAGIVVAAAVAGATAYALERAGLNPVKKLAKLNPRYIPGVERPRSEWLNEHGGRKVGGVLFNLGKDFPVYWQESQFTRPSYQFFDE